MYFQMLFTFLTTIAQPLVNKVLAGLGIGAISYVGINIMLDQVKSFIISNMGSGASDMLALLGLAKVDIAINIVLSAVTARAVYAGMQSGTIKKVGSIGK